MSEVEITLNGKTETLRCTLRAARRVNAGGGFAETLRRLQSFDMDAFVAVVAAGLDKPPATVEEAVFTEGTMNLAEPLANYVMLLANGGKPLKAAAENADSGEA